MCACHRTKCHVKVIMSLSNMISFSWLCECEGLTGSVGYRLINHNEKVNLYQSRRIVTKLSLADTCTEWLRNRVYIYKRSTVTALKIKIKYICV